MSMDSHKRKDNFGGYIHYSIRSKRAGPYTHCLVQCSAHGRNSIFVDFRSFELIKDVYVLIKALLAVSPTFIFYLKVDKTVVRLFFSPLRYR